MKKAARKRSRQQNYSDSRLVWFFISIDSKYEAVNEFDTKIIINSTKLYKMVKLEVDMLKAFVIHAKNVFRFTL